MEEMNEQTSRNATSTTIITTIIITSITRTIVIIVHSDEESIKSELARAFESIIRQVENSHKMLCGGIEGQ
jgi:hypothetical protein